MKKYKILHVEYRDYVHPEAGGAEVVLQEVYKRLANQGHQIDYLTSKYGTATDEEMMDGVHMIRTGNKWNFNWVAPRYYQRNLEKNQYDVIIEGIDKIPFYFPKYTKTPVLALVPHLFGTTAFEEAPFPAAAYVWLMERFIPWGYRDVPYYMTYSESTKEDLSQRGVSADKIHVVYIAINHDLYKPPKDGIHKTPHTLCYVGRIKRYKFIEYGILAVEQLKNEFPDIMYHVVGRGDNLPNLQEMVKKKGLENHIKFWGFVDDATKVDILQKSQIVLYNSVKEGWGLTAIEASACGTPVIASNSPGLKEAVVDGKTGYLVRHGDIDQLTGKIRDIFKSTDLQQELEKCSIEWASTFNWDKTAERWLEFIEKTVEYYKKK